MHTERYRSGHNEAVLKTVCPQGRVGSNPTLSVGDISPALRYSYLCQLFGEVPKWLKGHPWKGCRSLIAARGFKSLLLRRLAITEQYEVLILKYASHISERHEVPVCEP